MHEKPPHSGDTLCSIGHWFWASPAECQARIKQSEDEPRPACNPHTNAPVNDCTTGVPGTTECLARGKGKASIAFRNAGGSKCRSPSIKAFLAEGMALMGDLDNALQLIEEAIAQVERPRWEERVHYAEILRLKGWMLSLKGDLEGAERNFLASLDWASRQQAKSWELRTSTSLARLWQSQGKRRDAYKLLAPVYGWFTEGFDALDLKDAKALLDELA
jgi:hypothetical protein